MALITSRTFGESIILTLSTGENVTFEFRRSRNRSKDIDVHIDAPQSVTISRGEEPRTVDDRLREELA